MRVVLDGELGDRIPAERRDDWFRNDIGGLDSPQRLLPPAWECRPVTASGEILASEVHPSPLTAWFLLFAFTAGGAVILRRVRRRRD